MEASGTSGMKAAANGGAQPVASSTAGGPRATTPTSAGPSAPARSYDDLDYQDDVESQALYDLLEKEVVPLFYDRGARRPAARAGSRG